MNEVELANFNDVTNAHEDEAKCRPLLSEIQIVL